MQPAFNIYFLPAYSTNTKATMLAEIHIKIKKYSVKYALNATKYSINTLK